MKLTHTPRFRRAVALSTCTLAALGGLSVWGVAGANAAGEKPLDIVLGVGTDASQKIVNWYYPNGAQQAIEISEGTALTNAKKVIAVSAKNEVTDAGSAATAKLDDGTAGAYTAQTGYYNSHVTLRDLKPNTKYTYHVGAADGSGWSPEYTFYTGSADTSSFTFAAFGDPQIGSSGFAHHDGRGWAKTLDYIARNDPQTELLVSTGDQVETANDEVDWSNWADPDRNATGAGITSTPDVSPVLKQITYAAQIGNHEASGRAYHQHFALPNEDDNALFTAGQQTASRPGGDYWYVYKNVLFIDINSNAYDGGSDAAHTAYIKDVVAQHGQGTKWQIVTFHHAIYSPASHANDADNSQRRKDLPYTLSQQGIDMVIQGHDHAYSRSYELRANTDGTAPSRANAAEQPGSQAVATGPGGVIYITVDSSSGSKYYPLTAPSTANNSDYLADTANPGKNDANLDRHWANSVESQPFTPTYLQVKVTADRLAVKNIAVIDYNDPANSAYAHTGGIAAQADAGDKRETDPAKIHHFQTQGALSDTFDLTGGNTKAFPPSGTKTETVTIPGATTTVTASPSTAPTATVTVTAPPLPAPTVTVTSTVNDTVVIEKRVEKKIAQLTRKIRHAKGTKKASLQAQLAAYQQVKRAF